MQIVTLTETAIVTALKSGCSMKQVAQRVPAHVAKQMGVPVADFDKLLSEAEQRIGFDGMVTRILASFTHAERVAILKRK